MSELERSQAMLEEQTEAVDAWLNGSRPFPGVLAVSIAHKEGKLWSELTSTDLNRIYTLVQRRLGEGLKERREALEKLKNEYNPNR